MKSITTLIFIAVCNFLSAQEDTDAWKTVEVNSDFEIKVQKINCSKPTTGISKEYLFLELTNKRAESIELTYKVEKWYDGVCSNCGENTDVSLFSVELSAGESVSGNCENYRNRNLAIFSKMTGKSKSRELTSYKIIPLTLNGEKL